jgi:hypothetical protein
MAGDRLRDCRRYGRWDTAIFKVNAFGWKRLERLAIHRDHEDRRGAIRVGTDANPGRAGRMECSPGCLFDDGLEPTQIGSVPISVKGAHLSANRTPKIYRHWVCGARIDDVA